jgi:hypothetical protein
MPLGLRPIARENYSLGKAALFLFQDFNAYRHSSNTITALKTLGEDIRLYRQTRTQLLPAAAHTRTGAELTSYMRGTLERAYIGALDARGQHPNLPGFVRDREEHFTRWLDETVLADYHLQLSKALTNPPKTLNLSDINSFGNANFGHGTWFEAADGKKITSYNPLLIEEGDQRFLYLARDAAVEKSEQIPIK